MAKKKEKKTKTPDLPGITGVGVAAIQIAEIDKAVTRYERKKEEWTKTSPGVVDAKRELRSILHAHREELPKNEDGEPFYRCDGVLYTLKESVKRTAADDEDSREDI